MVASTSFVAVGLLGGFAYLAYVKKKELLCYGLASVGAGFFLDGVRFMTGEAGGFGSFLGVLTHVAFGIGGAFLAYVATVEGWKLYRFWKERRHEAEVAFQAKIAANKREPRKEPEGAVAPHAPAGKKTGA